jgi:hypothetical protein
MAAGTNIKKDATAPNDMCVKHQEWQEYTPPGTDARQSRYGKAYYHFDNWRIWLKHPWFIPNQLVIPNDKIPMLTQVRKLKLRDLFDIDI